MYFFGGDFNKDDVGKFMGSSEPVGKDVTGMRLRIGVRPLVAARALVCSLARLLACLLA